MAKTKKAPITEINKDKIDQKGSVGVVQVSEPYVVLVTIVGTDPILFHRFDTENAEAKAKAAKGSTEKKTDNVESYVYRGAGNELIWPGINFKGALRNAAKFKQDPRSSRKSMADLLRAAVKVKDASFGVDTWDYLDKRPAKVQQNGITRTRPAMKPGWKLSHEITVMLPEYLTPRMLSELCVDAGRLIGIGDYRPDFGCFSVERFEVLELDSQEAAE
jgi:hypothetical protein